MRLGLGLGLARSTGGGGGSPAVDLSDNFSADFVGVANNTPLRTVTGWLEYNSTGSTDNKRNRLIVNNEQIEVNGGIGSGTPLFIIAHELDSRGLLGAYMRFKLGTGFNQNMAAAIGSTNEANCQFVRWSGGNTVFVEKFVAGVRTELANNGGVAFAAGDIVEITLTSDMKISLYRNGVLHPNFNALNLNSSGGTAVIGQRSGFFQDMNFQASNCRADDVYISSRNGNVTVTNAATFYPSDFINTGASASDYTGHDVPVSGTYATTGLTPTGMQVRVVDELNSATQYQTWTTVTGFTAAGGTWSGTVRILPTVATARLQARFYNDTSITGYATTTIAVGPTAMYYGQSNAAFSAGIGSADTAVDAYKTRNTYSFVGDLAILQSRVWNRNDNACTSQVLARALYDMFGFTAGVCGGGAGAQPATALRKTAPTASFADPYNGGALTSVYQLLTNQLVAARANGRIMTMIYDQGEAEGDQTGSNVNFTDYTTDVTSIFTDTRTDFSGARNILGLLTITGRGTGTLNPNNDFNWSGARNAQKAMTATIPNCIIGQNNLGVVMSDAFHYASGVQGKVEKHRRNGKSIQFALLGTGYKGSGPQTLSGTRLAAVITLPITANGATSYSALSGVDGTTAGSAAALTSWEVSTDDFATTLTITSVTLTGTDVVITLAANPGTAVKVRNHYGKNPTTTSWVFGTYSDGFKIALEPLVVPITVA